MRTRRQLQEFISKASQTLGANLVSLAVSVVTTLLVPRFLGIEEFGNFQLYLFYSSYLGLLHFGWNDGVLLRLAGSQYADLEQDRVFSQFMVLTLQQAFVGLVILVAGLAFASDTSGEFIVVSIAVCVVLTGPQYMLLFVLQATLRVKAYASIVVLQRVLFCVLAAFAVAVDPRFELVVIADLLSRGLGLCAAVWLCRDLVFRQLAGFRFSSQDVLGNLRAGAPLMLGSMAGSLVVGVMRFGIAESWDVSTFGQVSLALSLANMALTSVAAVGLVAFPMLRRIQPKTRASVYSAGRHVISGITLFALVLYFPVSAFVGLWLPEYRVSSELLGILFPILVFQARSSILAEGFLKTLRRERSILWVNLGVLGLSVGLTAAVVVLKVELSVAMCGIVALLALRSVLLEAALGVRPGSGVLGDSVLEAVIVVIFIAAVTWLVWWQALLVWFLCWVVWAAATWRRTTRAVLFLRSR